MNRKSLVLVCVIVFAMIGRGVSAWESQTQAPPSMTQLLERITLLEARIEQLEKLQSTNLLRAENRSYVPNQPNALPTPQLRTIPKTWQRKSINGQPFYIIPTSHSKSVNMVTPRGIFGEEEEELILGTSKK